MTPTTSAGSPRTWAPAGEASDALQQTALWQQVLNDGIADLTADVDHDLRARFRAIVQHNETVIDGCDPTMHWAEIGAGWRTPWPRGRRQLRLGLPAGRCAGPRGGRHHVRRRRSGCGQDAGRQRPRMGAAFGGPQIAGLPGVQNPAAGPQGDHQHAGSHGGVLMASADVGGRAGHVQPGSHWVPGCCWAASPTARTWRTGCFWVRNEAKTNLRKFVDDTLFVVDRNLGTGSRPSAQAAGPLPRDRRPDHASAQRVAAEAGLAAAARHEETGTQHARARTRTSALTSWTQVRDNVVKPNAALSSGLGVRV